MAQELFERKKRLSELLAKRQELEEKAKTMPTDAIRSEIRKVTEEYDILRAKKGKKHFQNPPM